MPRPRVYKTDAIVLRQRKLGEADKIMTLYSAHLGKIDAVAKGARRTKSRLAGHLEPLTHGSYLLVEGRQLDIVTQAETVSGFAQLRTDLDRLSQGIYCAELVDRLVPLRSEGNPIFRLLKETLDFLDSGPALEIGVRRFEMMLLEQLGYRPDLQRCALCSHPLEPGLNVWNPAAGGVIGPECADDSVMLGPIGDNAIKVLRLLQRAPLDQLTRLQADLDLAAELRNAMEAQVHFALDRDVRSAAFVQTLRRGISTQSANLAE